jgi:hypothetical protein
VTTATVFPLRRPGYRAALRMAALALTARLVRIEARRSAMLLMLPPVILLFWFDTYRTAMSLPPFWALRSLTVQTDSMIDFAPLMAAAAAWTGFRDRRRRVTDLVSTTAWPRWTARLASWAATTCLAVVAYAGCVAAVYAATARQATWGGPLWWPVAVGAATVAAACALGFAAGAALPSRFTAPTVAVLVFAAFFAANRPLGSSPYALLSPFNNSLNLNLFADIGVFYSYAPDLAIVQVMFLAGVTVATLGAFGLPRSSGGPWSRRAAALACVAGLASAGTAVGLVGAARLDAHDTVVVPALHDAASDQPLAYTPVCAEGAIPVCVHPAFRAYLPELTTALRPVLSVVDGLPGAPVRVTQQATTFYLNSAGFQTPQIDAVSQGSPAVISLPLGTDAAQGVSFGQSVVAEAAPAIVAGVTGIRLGATATPGGVTAAGTTVSGTAAQQAVVRGATTAAGTAAQLAVAFGLLKAAGIAPLTPAEAASGTGPGGGSLVLAPGSPVYAAAMRFAALNAPARRVWLVTHLPALRAGHLPLSQLP